MTVKELKEALENVPDDAEVYMDDVRSIKPIPADYAEYIEYKNVLIIL